MKFEKLWMLLLACLLLSPGSTSADVDESIEEALQPARGGPKHSVTGTRCPKGTKLVGKPPPKGEEQFCQHKKEGHKTGPYARWNSLGKLAVSGAYFRDQPYGEWTKWGLKGEVTAHIGQSDPGKTRLHCDAGIDLLVDDGNARLAFKIAEVSDSGEWTLFGSRDERACAARLCSAVHSAFPGKLFCEAHLASLLDSQLLVEASEYFATLDFEGDQRSLWSAQIDGERLRALSRWRAMEPDWEGPENAADLQELRASSADFERYLGADWVKETEGLIAQSVTDSVRQGFDDWKTQWMIGTPPEPQLSLVTYIEAWAVTVDELRTSSGGSVQAETFQVGALSALRTEVKVVLESLIRVERYQELGVWVAAWSEYLDEEGKAKAREALSEMQAQVKADIRSGLAARPDAGGLSALAKQVEDSAYLLDQDWRLATQKQIFKAAKGVAESARNKAESRIRTFSEDALDEAADYSFEVDAALDTIGDLPEEAIDGSWLKTAQQRAERFDTKWSDLTEKLLEQQYAEEEASEREEEAREEREAREEGRSLARKLVGSYLCHNESRAYILKLNSPGSFRWTHDSGEWITGAWKVLDESVHLEATNSDKGELGEDYSKIIYKVAGRGGCASNPFCGGGNWDAGWALKGPVSGGGSASRWRRWAGFCHPR